MADGYYNNGATSEEKLKLGQSLFFDKHSLWPICGIRDMEV